MNIGILGSGRIGGTVGSLWARAGHQVMFSSRHPEDLNDLVGQAGDNARVGTVAEAARFGDVLLLAVPWSAIDETIQAAGGFNGKIIIDATNPFAAGGLQNLPNGQSSLAFNMRRMPGARVVKAYNTLTSGFQSEAAGREGADRVAMPYAGENEAANRTVVGLINDSGFDAFDVGYSNVRYMEPPRRPGAFYGEAWQIDTAQQLLDQITD